ncbi:MAG: peptidyl-prolyl cis-trans isomerase [Elusimicrobia bacterium]|nr:peptidyl-prolyl cis-trans isomerase [Elusimicrobiota bacterium]
MSIIRALVISLAAAPVVAQAQPASKGILVNGKLIDKAVIERQLWQQHGNNIAQQLVDSELLRQEAQALKIKANSKEINARIAKLKEQVGPNFEAQLKNSGTTMEALRSQIADSLMVEGLLKKVKGLDVTEKEIKDAYETNRDRLGTPERIRLRHILVANRQTADDTMIALKAGADFGKLAQARSMDQATGQKNGELGLFSPGMLTPEIEKAVFGLKPGEISEVVQTQMGFHILQVTEKLPAKPAQFKDIKENLRGALLQQKISQVLPAYLEELRAKAKVEVNL